MAEGVNVGTLKVTIDGDTRGLEAAAKRAGKSLQGVKKDTESAARTAVSSFTNMAKSILPVVSAVAAVTFAMRTFSAIISQTTALDNLSQSTGISIERLDGLRAIALQTGVQFETLSQLVSQFGARMASELQSSTSRGSQAIRALGIDVRDAAGNIRQVDELLPTLADKFSQFADGSNKAALAAALFGEEAGPRLIPLLNRGRAGLEEIRRATGRTFTASDAARVRDYNASMGRLQIAFEKLAKELSIMATGPINFLADRISGAAKGLDVLNRAAERAGTLAVDQNRAYSVQLERLKTLKREYDEMVHRQRAGLGDSERLAGAIRMLSEDYNAQLDIVRKLRSAINEYRQVALAAKAGIAGAANAVDFLQAPGLEDLEGNREKLAQAQFELDQLMERLTGTRDLFDDINLSWSTHSEVVQQALAKVDDAYEKSGERRRALAQINAQLAKQEQAAILDTASLAAQTITQIWPQQKGAAVAAAIINTAVGVTKALSSLPPPWSFVQAGLVAAAGAAQIAQIRSTNVTGGGSTTAPSAAAAAPAEPQQAPPGRSLFIQGIDPAALFSGRQLEELIRSINTEVQNGATLISTRNLPI